MSTEKKPRKNYTVEFKEEAVARCEKIGVTKTSKELGVSQATLNRWRNEKNLKPFDKAENKPTYEELEKENCRLKKENGYIKDINDVLKKSTAIFSNKELGGLK